MNKTRLHCATCQEIMALNEDVNVDILNTITHKTCNSEIRNKDHGTLEEMINKHPFFKSILQPQ